MDFRYLIFLLIFIFRSIISCSQSDTPSLPKQIVNIDNKSGLIADPQENITENPVQTFSKDMVIQVGAFHQELKALALKDWLSHMIDKPVIIVPEDGYFKVRLSGLSSMHEIERIIPLLGLLGIKNLWVFRAKGKGDIKSQIVVQPDTTFKVVVENKNIQPVVVEVKPVPAEPTFNLQVGVFYGKSKALRAKRRIKNKLNLSVEIVQEWEYYIVFVNGFKTREEIFKYYPKLAAMGYPDSYMIENNIGSQDKITR